MRASEPSNAVDMAPVATPPRSVTPPPVTERRRSDKRAYDGQVRGERAGEASGVDSIDPNALGKALLKEFEDAGRRRDTGSGGSPSRKRQRVYGDR